MSQENPQSYPSQPQAAASKGPTTTFRTTASASGTAPAGALKWPTTTTFSVRPNPYDRASDRFSIEMMVVLAALSVILASLVSIAGLLALIAVIVAKAL